MCDSICLINMLAHDLSVHNKVNASDCNKTNGNASSFSYKSMFPTLTQLTLLKVNVYNEFTQYMLVWSWVKVGNILLYKKNIEASPLVYRKY